MLIDKDLRAILINDRHGPEALVVAGNPGAPASSPAAPWDSFTVATYLDVGEPTNTSGLYAFEIRDFFRVHPRFLVKAFDRHERSFPFPATHCVDREDDDDREDSAGPHGGTTGLSGSPSPRAVAGDSSAASWSDSLLSTKYILIAAGGLLMTLGGLAMAWLRRRRSAE
ncbi:hypothetical protein AB0G54_38135 [Streptomyces yokosukanensis]|uniref:hypothetical protein n=1 Tax=Streptomyces yokosukanensis TaxID=67386 RepID=UPI0034158207